MVAQTTKRTITIIEEIKKKTQHKGFLNRNEKLTPISFAHLCPNSATN
jgi:hypothetical protein